MSDLAMILMNYEREREALEHLANSVLGYSNSYCIDSIAGIATDLRVSDLLA